MKQSDKTLNTKLTPEEHPLRPFTPEGAKILMLGSFPPPRERWSMDFYYPNLQNDMWRIFGIIFFNDKEYFLEQQAATNDTKSKRTRSVFSKPRLETFLTVTGIALSDTAHIVIRHKGNASDKFLEVVEKVDLLSILEQIPECTIIVTTGDKATQTLTSITGSPEPSIGSCSEFSYAGRAIKHYRMPSSSRAYPLPLPEKAKIYESMFRSAGIL